MPPDPIPTRRKLLDSALRLFAEHGANAVPMTDINRAANQRNNAALVYHFGGRHGVLRAILDEYVPRLRSRRLELLGAAVAADPDEVRPVVEALVLPVTELLAGSWRDRAYLQIHFELTCDPSWSTDELVGLLGRAGSAEVLTELRRRRPGLPEEVRVARDFMLTSFVAQATAARARSLTVRRRPHESALSHELFTANLVEMVTAAAVAPLSASSVLAG